nr:hypothetical protein [Tanacetum cinerariifolium]
MTVTVKTVSVGDMKPMTSSIRKNVVHKEGPIVEAWLFTFTLYKGLQSPNTQIITSWADLAVVDFFSR